MRLPKSQRVELTAQALARLVESGESMYRKFLLCKCVQAYALLTTKERQDLDSLLVSEPYSGVQAMAKTWYEQGEEKGEEKGQRKLLRRQLERRFGPLKGSALKKFENWPAEKLPELGEAILTAKSLKELGLEK